MKNTIRFLSLLTVVLLLFTSCSLVDKNKDSQGYYQFIAEFNSGLFAFTNKSGSNQEYSSNNPKLKKTFKFGERGLSFNAEYSDRIVYTVANPTEDRIDEAKTFGDIYKIYYDSWKNYTDKTNIGTLSVEDGNIRVIEMTVSGYSYSVTFEPYAEVPTITYQKTTIA